MSEEFEEIAAAICHARLTLQDMEYSEDCWDGNKLCEITTLLIRVEDVLDVINNLKALVSCAREYNDTIAKERLPEWFCGKRHRGCTDEKCPACNRRILKEATR